MFDQGRPLHAAEREMFQIYFQPRTLHKVRIVEGHTPFWLHKNMCAVVLGARIYFREGVYQFNTRNGIELLAHELTHVEQYLSGMTVLKYLWASRRGYRKNPYEIEAYAKGVYVYEHISFTQLLFTQRT
ncbi:MAG: DUF4157 domain-containing protein [Methylotenera sp.]|nr:DUF4157 domain-containing protein [Methylotenera sp.]MDP3307179.1 DUF4157 domain-containing protein [Methylotenera sp.]MDP3818750.1 DUF4157 domain-containing protein [Methylotenera sp.]MDZ4212365.1 DUF4157 domain-containing protein [Methylotenera sp.]